ncbi:9208_t:CDS:2, partial [Scutellospora calospora]
NSHSVRTLNENFESAILSIVMTDSREPQKPVESHPPKIGDENSKKLKDIENIENKRPSEINSIEVGARTVAHVDEYVMMAMPELLETNKRKFETTRSNSS